MLDTILFIGSVIGVVYALWTNWHICKEGYID
jgi:hypothetical protein